MDLYYNTSLHLNKEDYNLLDEAREYKKTLTTNLYLTLTSSLILKAKKIIIKLGEEKIKREHTFEYPKIS